MSRSRSEAGDWLRACRKRGGRGGGRGLEKVCSARSSSPYMWLMQTTLTTPKTLHRAHSCSRGLGRCEICMSALVGRHFLPAPRASQNRQRGRRKAEEERRKSGNLFPGYKAAIGETFTPGRYKHSQLREEPGHNTPCVALASLPELLSEFPAKTNIWPSTITCSVGVGGIRCAWEQIGEVNEKSVRQGGDAEKRPYMD